MMEKKMMTAITTWTMMWQVLSRMIVKCKKKNQIEWQIMIENRKLRVIIKKSE